MILYSLLDFSPITEGSDAAQAFANTVDLAQHAERWGYHRYWLAEHHNMPGIGSAATAVVIGHVAGATQKIRVGSGGIMLPNHSPLVVAEQFGTLESLYPGRIDLGLGRAPGTDQVTARALRRSGDETAESFPQDVLELQSYFERSGRSRVHAVPGNGLSIPIYLLGSSLFSAEVAAHLGLPFAFASHFAPDYLHEALRIYRAQFQPSTSWREPHAIVGIGLYAADSDEEARKIFTSAQLMGLGLIRGHPGKLPSPVDSMSGMWRSDLEREAIEARTRYAVVGSKATIRDRIEEIVRATAADEIIAVSQIYDHAARLHSFAIGAEVLQEIARPQPALTA